MTISGFSISSCLFSVSYLCYWVVVYLFVIKRDWPNVCLLVIEWPWVYYINKTYTSPIFHTLRLTSHRFLHKKSVHIVYTAPTYITPHLQTHTHTDIQVSCIPLEICPWHFITLGLSPVSFDVLSLAESVSEGEAN